MKYRFIILFLLVVFSCTDLERGPYSLATANVVFGEASNYDAFLAKVYAGLSVTGQQGPAGNGDLQGFDEGASGFLRSFWYLQELPTDEALIRWNDPGVREFNNHAWTSSNSFINSAYARLSYQIALCNEYLFVTKDVDNLVNKDIVRAEVQIIRALAYWYLMDFFGSVPIVTEPKGALEAPAQPSRQELFNFIEAEALEAEGNLLDAGQNEYGRADKAMAWMLLAKLYLNAEVYTGAGKYAECITYCEKIINSEVYEIEGTYLHVFAADNHESKEIIFPIPFDGMHTQSWAGMIFFGRGQLNADWGGGDAFGLNEGGGWNGPTITPDLASLFGPTPESKGIAVGSPHTHITDTRYQFFTEADIINNIHQKRATPTDPFTFTNDEGYRVKKFLNLKKDGTPGSTISDFPDNDWPLFRLGDTYLMYAEAVLRGGGGERAAALGYVNELRTRAAVDDIADSDLTLDFLIDERARELYWEGHRRSDLVRFGQFSDKGAWAWKGGEEKGKPTDKFRDVFPIPVSQIVTNPNLKQNEGY